MRKLLRANGSRLLRDRAFWLVLFRREDLK